MTSTMQYHKVMSAEFNNELGGCFLLLWFWHFKVKLLWFHCTSLYDSNKFWLITIKCVGSFSSVSPSRCSTLLLLTCLGCSRPLLWRWGRGWAGRPRQSPAPVNTFQQSVKQRDVTLTYWIDRRIYFLTWHISVMVSSKTPPASSAPSPTSLTFQALDGSRRSEAFSFTTWRAIWTKMGLHFRPLQEEKIFLSDDVGWIYTTWFKWSDLFGTDGICNVNASAGNESAWNKIDFRTLLYERDLPMCQ